MSHSTKQLNESNTSEFQIICTLEEITKGMQRLADLEVSGRVMMTFMRGHMAEATKSIGAKDYFKTYYNSMGQEFIQFDDYDFVVHHCLRYQFWHIREELDLLRISKLGRILEEKQAGFPKLIAPISAGRRPAVARGWYEEVYRSLESGVLPTARGQRNAVMPEQACIMRQDAQLDLIWPQFLIWCGEVWGRQIVAAWHILRNLIQMRRFVTEKMHDDNINYVKKENLNLIADAVVQLVKTYEDWNLLHAGTVDIHDPMYDANLKGMGEWAAELSPDLVKWGIKDIIKDEMYLELAATVLKMRGKKVIKIPNSIYWRRTQFAADCIKIGAPNMPPF